VVNQYNVFVGFLVKSPNYGYIWTDSRVKVSASDFLGKRVLEVTKGQTGAVTVVEKNDVITGLLDKDMSDTYVPPEKTKGGVWVREVEESPTATEKLDQIVKSIESALPALTNQLATLLNNGAHAVSNFNMLTVSTQPVATNLAEITAELREFNGSLGRWLFSTSFNYQLDWAATNANSTLTGVDTNMLVLAEKLSLSFDHLASITSNLNEQVRSNTNVLSAISQAVSHSDEFVQGLKRHWLLRSAFKTKSTNSPPARPVLRPGRPQP
jgi:hypothetical protein